MQNSRSFFQIITLDILSVSMTIINLKAYIPQTDTYIEKDTEVNERIEKMRLEATAMLMSGEPTIIISTVSCIYSLGSPKEWEESATTITKGMVVDRKVLIHNLIESRYERNDVSLVPGSFRVKGDTIDIIPGYSDDVIRILLFGDEIEKISIHDHISYEKAQRYQLCKDLSC